VRARTPIFERTLVVDDVVLAGVWKGHSFFYADYGDFFAHACTAATVLLSLIAVHRGRKKKT
jgi:hypothetical protein